MAGGECRVFSPPKYVVLGKTQYDQDYIDGEVEAGIGGCGFKRPLPRPAELDATVTRQIAAPGPAPKPKKRKLIQRLREAIVQRPRPAPPPPEAPLAASPPPPVEAPLPAPPPKLDPVDELLRKR